MSRADRCSAPGRDILYARPDYYPDGYREDEELYVDEQNCDNCKFGCDHGCPMSIDSYMTTAEKNEVRKRRKEDSIMRNGEPVWCIYWKGRRRRRGGPDAGAYH